MPLIVHHKDIIGLLNPDRYTVATGQNFLSWLKQTFGNSENMCAGLAVDILLNGKTIFQSDDAHSDEKSIDIDLGPYDQLLIINRPAGIDPFTIALVAVVVAAASVVLATRPVKPGDTGQQKTSPNNQQQAAQNAFRPGQAIPDIFGNIIAYPDFVQPSAFEYINNSRVVTELFCIGVGRYTVTDVRSENTLLSSIPNSSFTLYQPGQTPPSSQLVIHQGTNEVDGQVLLAPDDESIVQQDQLSSITADGVNNTTVTVDANSTLIQDLNISVGSFLAINARTITMPQLTLLQGNFEVLAIDTSGAEPVLTLNTTDGVTTPGTFTDTVEAIDANGDSLVWLGWFSIPGDMANEIFFHWQMPQGIRSERGNQITVQIELQIQALDSGGSPTGAVFTQTIDRSGATLDPQFVTTKFNTTNTPGMTVSQYRARARRLTNQFDGAASQQIKMEDFVSLTPYTNPAFGDVTLIYVERLATTFALSERGNRINANVTRLLPNYNRVSGQYETSNLVATRDFADAVAYNLIVAAGRDTSTVNLAELYAIQDGLSNAALGYFDFSFDDFDVSLGERVKTICNVARVAPFRDGAIWRFTRDEAKPVRTALFTRRIMSTRESTQGWQLQRPDDKDSVALTFVDPDSNIEDVIYRRVDINTGTIFSDAPGSQPLEISLAGCRNSIQANNRADVEIRRLIYQRRTVNDTVLRDGLLVGLNERVGWVDPNDTILFDGEIVGIVGNSYDTTEAFRPEPGGIYFVYVTDTQGNPSNAVPCIPRTDTEFGFIGIGLSGAYLPQSGTQGGSRYYIGTQSDQAASDFLVTRRTPSADGSVRLELAEYVPVIYEND